jgi:WD40 repeat protein
VWVLDAATGKELLRLTGHESTAVAVAYSRDGTLIAPTGLDRTVRVWDAKTGQPVAVFRGHTGAGQGVAFTADGRAVLSAALDGTVRSWRLPR